MQNQQILTLSVVVTVVGGKECLRNHLEILCPQARFHHCEILVPFDCWSEEIGSLASEFPEVTFSYRGDLGLKASATISKSNHCLYDRRRAVGLRLCRGNIVALTEDHAIPADDWLSRILLAHEQPYDVIGGAVENGVDRPMNRAWYFCDFGRYGRPFESREVQYVSDVNISYKRKALMKTQGLWWDAYHETTVNWALQALGIKLFLDAEPVVYQFRPRLSFWRALRERAAWGKVFATTRAAMFPLFRRLLFAVGTFGLPVVLCFRALRHMNRQDQGALRILSTFPVIACFVVCWSVGEMAGYLFGGHGTDSDTSIESKSAMSALRS